MSLQRRLCSKGTDAKGNMARVCDVTVVTAARGNESWNMKVEKYAIPEVDGFVRRLCGVESAQVKHLPLVFTERGGVIEAA